MMAQQAPPPQEPPDPPVRFDKFTGLKNTVAPERLSNAELQRAENIDIDDLGEAHRRRGYTQRLIGVFHSLFTTNGNKVLVVMNGTLGRINPDFTFMPLVTGIPRAPLAYVQVGRTLYYSSISVSGKIDLKTNIVSPWGRIISPSYTPATTTSDPPNADFWFSPVVNPEPTLGSVGGRLLGPAPFATALTWFNGRIYLAGQRTLWATELFLYDYVDKTKGYRHFEEDITALGMVEDGIYVGTAAKLYFLSGAFDEKQERTIREDAGVVPGSMITVPSAEIDPEARRFPDIPYRNARCMVCLTTEGIVLGMPGGQTFRMTHDRFLFPNATRSATLFRHQDGMHTIVQALNSGGTPVTATARFTDRFDAEIIRANRNDG
jgi:hypothetical protein